MPEPTLLDMLGASLESIVPQGIGLVQGRGHSGRKSGQLHLQQDSETCWASSRALVSSLAASVREGGAILRGKTLPARAFVVDGPNVKRLRANYQLSQAEFAALLGISVKTLRNWEQGRRAPEGPARVLLQVAAKHPDAVWDVVRPVRHQRSAKPGKLA